MAKDGTNCGGARPGAGRPRKALADKIASGNPGGRALTQIKIYSNLAVSAGVADINFFVST